MKEIIIIKTENSGYLKNLLDKEHINYEIYQEPVISENNNKRRKRLIEGYKRSSQSNQGIFRSLEYSAINDFLKSNK